MAERSFTLQQFFNMLNAWTPQSGEQPGKQRIYTHAGTCCCSSRSNVATVDRRRAIKDRILKPLGMNQTFLPERGPDNRAIMAPELSKRVVQGYSDTGMAIGPPGNQQGYYDFPGTGQMFSSARDLATFVAACIDGEAIDPQLRQALQMTQRETFRVTEKFGQAMAWENIHLSDVDIVDKPGGLNNATAYVGLVPTTEPASSCSPTAAISRMRSPATACFRNWRGRKRAPLPPSALPPPLPSSSSPPPRGWIASPLPSRISSANDKEVTM